MQVYDELFGSSDLLLILILMLQKYEFPLEVLLLPNVIAIFFLILVILHCTPRYVIFY